MSDKPTRRRFTEILTELRRIKKSTSHLSDIYIIADALEWGYTTGRTSWKVDTNLISNPDLSSYVEQLAVTWNGENFLSGALRHIGNKSNEFKEK